MTPVARKGVLLRLTPDLLDRIDVAAGAMNRTAWITAVIIARLEAIAEADATLYTEELGEPAPLHFVVDEEVGTPAERDAYVQGASDALAIIDDDGVELGLVAVYREGGELEIGRAGGLFSDTTSPSGEPADQGDFLPVDPGERGEGSDPALTSSASSSEQGLGEPGTTTEGESSKGSDTARDAVTTRDTDSPDCVVDGVRTDGVGWPD